MTSRTMSVTDSVVIEGVHVDEVWAQVADPRQMGRWSPENTGAETSAGAARPLVVGETFVGSNRRGRARWHTRCVVTASEPGRAFAFRVERIGVRVPRLRGAIATWRYDVVPVESGTRVTETWYDDRRGWPDPVAAVFDRAVTGGRLFAEHQQRNIARTLAALKADLERTAA